MAFETHDLISFLWSDVCKWPVINVTLLTLKIATNGIFSNSMNEIILALHV